MDMIPKASRQARLSHLVLVVGCERSEFRGSGGMQIQLIYKGYGVGRGRPFPGSCTKWQFGVGLRLPPGPQLVGGFFFFNLPSAQSFHSEKEGLGPR